MPTLRQEPGKLIERTWTTRGADGRKIRHTALGFDLTVNGKRERRFSSAWLTEQDVLDALARRRRELAGGIEAAPDWTLADLAREYLKQQEQRDRRGRTFEARLFRTRLLPRLGATLLVRNVTAPMLARYEHERAGQVGRWTVRHELGALGRALRMAHRLGVVDRLPEIPRPPKGEHRTRFLSEDEITRLLAACRQSRNRLLLPLVILAITTGCRYAELTGLRWSMDDADETASGWVDLDADHGLSAALRLERTKGGRPRTVPLAGAAIAALVALVPDPSTRTGRVFRLDGSSVRKAFDLALRRAGISKGTDHASRVSFHTLRHTAGSWLTMTGASLRSVQEILGHATPAQTARYAHVGAAHMRSDLERLTGLIAPVAAGNGGAGAHGVAQLAIVPA
jgi:integrase